VASTLPFSCQSTLPSTCGRVCVWTNLLDQRFRVRAYNLDHLLAFPLALRLRFVARCLVCWSYYHPDRVHQLESEMLRKRRSPEYRLAQDSQSPQTRQRIDPVSAVMQSGHPTGKQVETAYGYLNTCAKNARNTSELDDARGKQSTLRETDQHDVGSHSQRRAQTNQRSHSEEKQRAERNRVPD